MKRFAAYSLVLLPILVGIGQLFLSSRAASAKAADPAGEPGASGPEQLVFMLQYLGTDYGVAVEDGAVVSELEYQEMLDFSQALIDRYQLLKPDDPAEILPSLQKLRHSVEARAESEVVRRRAGKLVRGVSDEFNVTAFPATPPRYSSGKSLYQTSCIRCHGQTGAGDGPSVAEEKMDPEPRSFRDQRVNTIPPHQVFNAVTFGVEGTAMPSHETLSVQERWDVSFYVFTLREDFAPREPAEEPGVSLKELATQTNLELASRLAGGGESEGMGWVDYLRRYPPGPSTEELLLFARDLLKRSAAAFRQGDPREAAALSLDAYLYGVEPAEAALTLVDSGLVNRLERELARYRVALTGEAPQELAEQHLGLLMDSLEEARTRQASAWGGGSFTFVQSLTIILREGIEAALLVGLLLAYLTRVGRKELRVYVYWGCLGGGAAGLLTWMAGHQLLASAGHREALEGITSLLAAAVLFWVSLWIFHNLDVQRWKSYMHEQASRAVSAGSGWFLASAAFLAVYREAVETALFYQALWLRSGYLAAMVISGFAAGMLLLFGFVVIWLKLGIRLNLKPFFVISGILLGTLSVIFAGYGVRELQNVGYLQQTSLDWMIALPFFEIWPVREGLILQLGIVLSFLLGWQLARRQALRLPGS